MKAARRVRAALLRLAPPWRRRHPVVLATVTESAPVRVTFRSEHYPACNDRCRGDSHWLDDAYAAERDPTDEAGA